RRFVEGRRCRPHRRRGEWRRADGPCDEPRAAALADRIGPHLCGVALLWRGSDSWLVSAEGLMILSLIVFLPLVGALLILLGGGSGDRPEREGFVRIVALAVSLLTFALTLVLWARFDPTSADYQFVERHAWIPAFGIQYF